MGNSQSGVNNTNTNVNLYDQYINEQKRIIAAQQEQISNLSNMYLNHSYQQQNNHNTPSNILLKQMNTNINNHQQPVGTTNNVPNQNIPQLPQIEPPNSQKLNPYKILSIPKNYDEKILKKAYLKMAMKTHPDRGGSQIEFQKVSIAYTLLLKKLSDKNNNNLHNDLRNNSKSYMNEQSSNNMKNTKMTDQFDINLFNKIYDENKIESVYDHGYGDWMEENSNAIEQPKMFNKTFNKDLFNHEFNKYKVQQQKHHGSQMIKYDEPQVDISMRGKDSIMVLGQDNISDFSGESSGGLAFRDYKDAFTNSCLIDTSSVNLNDRLNDLNSLKSSRSNVNYKMSDKDLKKQELMKIKLQKEEEQRINRLKKSDNLSFNNYERIHDRMLQR
tara:strand:+ start:1871 stop:3028 length:1158 start_codon:yes stop_codon:yes gene_type:complete